MRVLLATLLAMALFAPPAAADEADQITDVCGDAFAWATVDGETTSSPDPLSPDWDIRSAGFTTIRDGDEGAVLGVDFTMAVCGDIVEPEYMQYYSFNWRNEAGCRLRLAFERWAYVGPADAKVPLVLTFRETCEHPEQDLPIATRVYDEFDLRMEPTAVTVDGDRLTVALRGADLPEEAQAAIAEGQRLVEPYAAAHMAWGPTSVFYRDPEHGVTVTGGRDSAQGDDFVIGQ